MSGTSGEAPSRPTILVVEDNEVLQDLIRLGLEETGSRIIVAGSSADAAALVAGERIDLLIADVVLPGMSGPELATTLRAAHPGLRVVYVTGWEDHAALADVGEDVRLTKPFTLEELRQAVASALGDEA